MATDDGLPRFTDPAERTDENLRSVLAVLRRDPTKLVGQREACEAEAARRGLTDGGDDTVSKENES